MTLIIETGIGIEDADSYCSTEQADEYHTKFGNEKWLDLDNDQKAIALRKATRDIDLLYVFSGVALTDTQALQLPTDKVGIVKAIVNATAEMALVTLTVDASGPIASTGNVSERSEEVAGIKESIKYFAPEDSATSAPTRRVTRLLRPYVASEASGDSMYLTVVRG